MYLNMRKFAVLYNVAWCDTKTFATDVKYSYGDQNHFFNQTGNMFISAPKLEIFIMKVNGDRLTFGASP